MRVRKLLATRFELDPESILPTTKLSDILGGDSLDMVELVMALEDEFDDNFPDDPSLGPNATVGDLANLLRPD